MQRYLCDVIKKHFIFPYLKKNQKHKKKIKKKTKTKNEKKNKSKKTNEKKENANVDYYTTYPKTPQKRTGNPNFPFRMRAPNGIPFGVT